MSTERETCEERDPLALLAVEIWEETEASRRCWDCDEEAWSIAEWLSNPANILRLAEAAGLGLCGPRCEENERLREAVRGGRIIGLGDQFAAVEPGRDGRTRLFVGIDEAVDYATGGGVAEGADGEPWLPWQFPEEEAEEQPPANEVALALRLLAAARRGDQVRYDPEMYGGATPWQAYSASAGTQMRLCTLIGGLDYVEAAHEEASSNGE